MARLHVQVPPPRPRPAFPDQRGRPAQDRRRPSTPGRRTSSSRSAPARGVLTARLAGRRGTGRRGREGRAARPRAPGGDAGQRRDRPRRHPEARPRARSRRRPASAALRLVGNIPYSISSPLLFRVLDERALLSDCAFLLQKEVAERVTAGPGHEELRPARHPAPERVRGPRRVHGGAGLVLAAAQGPVGAADAPPPARSPPSRRRRRALSAPSSGRPSPNAARCSGRTCPAGPRRPRSTRLTATLGLGRNARAEELAPGTLFALFRKLADRPSDHIRD